MTEAADGRTDHKESRVPPALRIWACDRDAESVERFDSEQETVSIGVTVTFRTDVRHDSVRVKPRNAPDGFRVAAVTSRMVGSGEDAEMKTTVQFRPEDA